MPKMEYIIPMMNDMMPTIEEAITPDIEAQLEHEEWERGQEERDRWGAVEAEHGPLLTAKEWAQHCKDLNKWFEDGTCK
jgi:hypothetical protein